LSATRAAAAIRSVDLPTPGSPASRTTDPGTRPPPSTRSSSAMPVGRWAASSAATSRIGRAGADTGPAATVRPGRAPTSPSVPHAWHSGQRPTHLVGELSAVGDIERVRGDVRLGVAAAVPVEVVAAGTPATPVVLRDRRHEHLGVVGAFHPVVGAADRQLPADVGLGLERVQARVEGVQVQRTTFAGGEARPVEEDARAVEPAGAALAVLDLADAALHALLAVLPLLVGEL